MVHVSLHSLEACESAHGHRYRPRQMVGLTVQGAGGSNQHQASQVEETSSLTQHTHAMKCWSKAMQSLPGWPPESPGNTGSTLSIFTVMHWLDFNAAGTHSTHEKLERRQEQNNVQSGVGTSGNDVRKACQSRQSGRQGATNLITGTTHSSARAQTTRCIHTGVTDMIR